MRPQSGVPRSDGRGGFAAGPQRTMDDPEICVTVTAPQLQEKESELKAMQQRLIHEAKEREKMIEAIYLQALLQGIN